MKRNMSTLAVLLCLCVLHAPIAEGKLLKRSVAKKGQQVPLVSDVPEDLTQPKLPTATPTTPPPPTATPTVPAAQPFPNTPTAPAAQPIPPFAAPPAQVIDMPASMPTPPVQQPQVDPQLPQPTLPPTPAPTPALIPPPASTPAPTDFAPAASNPTLSSAGGPKYKCVRKMGDDCVISFPDIQWSSRVVFEGPSSSPSLNPVPYAPADPSGAATAAASDANAAATLKADEQIYQQNQQFNHQITDSLTGALSGLQQLQSFVASHGGSAANLARATDQLQLTMRSVQIALDSIHLSTGVVTSAPTQTPMSTTPVSLPNLGGQSSISMGGASPVAGATTPNSFTMQ